MQLMWSTKAGRITTVGNSRLTSGVPRQWLLKLKMWNDKAKVELTLRPAKKLLVSDLEPLVELSFAEFAAEHGKATDASWTAIAR